MGAPRGPRRGTSPPIRSLADENLTVDLYVPRPGIEPEATQLGEGGTEELVLVPEYHVVDVLDVDVRRPDVNLLHGARLPAMVYEDHFPKVSESYRIYRSPGPHGGRDPGRYGRRVGPRAVLRRGSRVEGAVPGAGAGGGAPTVPHK